MELCSHPLVLFICFKSKAQCLEKEVNDLKEEQKNSQFKVYQSASSVSNLKKEVEAVQTQLEMCEICLKELTKKG